MEIREEKIDGLLQYIKDNILDKDFNIGVVYSLVGNCYEVHTLIEKTNDRRMYKVSTLEYDKYLKSCLHFYQKGRRQEAYNIIIKK
jgi:rRNA processing protein Gar1